MTLEDIVKFGMLAMVATANPTRMPTRMPFTKPTIAPNAFDWKNDDNNTSTYEGEVAGSVIGTIVVVGIIIYCCCGQSIKRALCPTQNDTNQPLVEASRPDTCLNRLSESASILMFGSIGSKRQQPTVFANNTNTITTG